MTQLGKATLASGTRAHYENARYYDQSYRRRQEDIAFYVKEATRSKGPVLELGAGTGRVARAIASEGIQILGIDASKTMLDQAAERGTRLTRAAQKNYQMRLADLRTFRSRRRFRLVIAPFNVLMHLYTRKEWEQALATVRRHLLPKGQFVFDVLMPDPAELCRDPDRVYRGGSVPVPGKAGRFRYGEIFEYDPVQQVQLVTMQFESKNRADSFITPLCHRQVFPAELEALLHYNGFSMTARYGDFDRGPLDDQSESQVIVATARRSRR